MRPNVSESDNRSQVGWVFRRLAVVATTAPGLTSGANSVASLLVLLLRSLRLFNEGGGVLAFSGDFNADGLDSPPNTY